MELNLSQILNFDGKRMQIKEEIPIVSDKADSFLVDSPVSFEGCAVNLGGTIELKGHASAEVFMVCDRCAEDFSQRLEFEVDERLKKEDEFSGEDEDPDFIRFSGTAIDLSEIIYKNLFMSLPTKTLCSNDCKGLCPICGINLNTGSCNCENDDTDPRFDILKQFL